jgi:hypothetical protein
MSDLQLALLALAAVVLVALYAYGKWQERQALKRIDASMRGGVGDALLESPAADAAASRAPAQRIEPRLSLPEGTPAPEAPAPLALAGVASHWAEDPLLDCVLELRCAHAVDGVTVFDAAVPLSRLALPLPVFLVAWDARAQQWVQPDRFGFYSELLVAVQMASRRHALDDIAVSRFVAAVQQVALALDADFDAPEAEGIVMRARELDRLCAQFDVQIGLTLQAQDGAWDAGALRGAAEQAGLVKAGDARWQRVADVDGDAVALFAMRCDALPAHRIALELDVPLVPPAAQPLEALFAAAERLATELNARIVDDNGRPIHAGSLPAIASQLERLYAEMRAAGIEPGSARARRLYA